MQLIANPLRGRGFAPSDQLSEGEVLVDPEPARQLYAACPAAHVTPLLDHDAIARDLGIGKLWLKDERGRIGLGSFKALGAAHAIAKQAIERAGLENAATALAGETFVCASAGNHGLSVAAGARLFGAKAVVYLSHSVDESFAERLRGKSATVVREGTDYAASMAAAAKAAHDHGWQLLSDSSWQGYWRPARDVMEGYLIMAEEVVGQISEPPTDLFLQAGVGGLAAACAGAARRQWGDTVRIIVVEPDRAPAIHHSILAGRSVITSGADSNMGRLDCKEPSHLALKLLAREADDLMLISDEEATQSVALLADHGIVTTPSGAGGFAGLHHCPQQGSASTINGVTRALAYITEGVEDR